MHGGAFTDPRGAVFRPRRHRGGSHRSPRCLDRVDTLFREGATITDQYQIGGLKRIGKVGQQRVKVGNDKAPHTASDHHPAFSEHRQGLSRVDNCA